MSLVTYIIFAKTLYKIHEKKSGCNEWERMKDETAVFRKQSICQHAQDLRVRSTMLMNAAQRRSIKKTVLYGE